MTLAKGRIDSSIPFKVVADFEPGGDQPQAVKRLADGIKSGVKHQTLLGVTGSGKTYTMAKVVEAVETSDKQRFAIEDEMIRANQGHTISVDLGLVPVVPPEFLFHGTYHEAVDAIEQEGLSKMKRHHVHLAVETGTAVQVGRRSGTPVVFKVASGQMHRDGYPFYCSVNGVWLVEEVPHEYLERLP